MMLSKKSLLVPHEPICWPQSNPQRGEVTILAFSAAKHDRDFLRLKEATESGRRLLSDRKGVFTHLGAKQLVSSSIRVAALQGSGMLANFLSDQIQAEAAREELVRDGKLSPNEADAQNDEWEKREWDYRLQNLPQSIYNGILKLHAITLVMRFYEGVASRIFDEVTLDRLTMDPFKAGIRVSETYGNDTRVVRRRMYETCWWSNAVAFLSDYSVHQVILVYGFYVYYQAKRDRERQKGTIVPSTNKPDSSTSLAFLIKSAFLMASRALGLFAAGIGGAWGTTFYPGWGTIIGSQVGDTIVATAFDSIQGLYEG